MMDAVKKKTNKTKNRKEQRERDGMVSQVAGLKGPVGANLERSWALSKTLKAGPAWSVWGTDCSFSVCTALSLDLWPLDTASLLSGAIRLMLPLLLPFTSLPGWDCCCCLVAQSCLTLCDPVDCSPPGSSVHGILQARVTGVGCHSLLQRPFLTQGSNLGLSHCRQILYRLSHQGSS